MRKTLLFSLFFIAAFAADAQIKRCYTYESTQDFRSKNPGAETDAQFEGWLTKRIDARRAEGARTNIAYTIPIIFHVVHNGEPVGVGSNLSQAQIQQQLNQLNADYSNMSGSVYAVAANTEIQFCLAVVGPDGKALAEPGINRINRISRGWSSPPYDGLASNSYVDATIMPNSIWNPYAYFNVWTLDLGIDLLGKATFPTSSTLNGLTAGETDTHAGVFVHYSSVGSFTSPGGFGFQYGLGRTLTHETGHWLGLRHIWGDGNCSATDYCADTPPQNGETSGCPSPGTLNGCSPSVAKMFENFMDYTDDLCVNTFTNDQKTRIQTVMLNSPRRKELATAGSCTVQPSNSIRFTTTAQAVSETGTVATCPKYREIVLSVAVYNTANGNATVTFTKGGTATDNVDYTITPSSVSYTNGDGAAKTVTVRIWDDGAVETPETIIIGYTISGGTGVSAASVNQTCTITINDDDFAPVINNSGTVNLVNEDFGTSGNALPAGWITGAFGGAGVNVWRVSTNGGTGFTGQSAYITNNAASAPFPNAYTITSPSDVILRTGLINGTGYKNLRFSFRYKCNGEIFMGTLYDYGTLMYSFNGSSFGLLPDMSTGNAYSFQGITSATNLTNQSLSLFDNSSFYLGFRWTNDNTDGSGSGFTLDDLVVTGDAKRIESDLSNSGSQNIFAGQEVYVSSGNDDQLLARIKNPSATLGCVTATVQQTGNGMVPVTTARGTFQRTQKVIAIVPSSNPSATHETTLYFTTAELAAWGADRLNLKILKVNDGVSLGTTITSNNAQVVTPTSVVENVAGGYIAYTGNFNGFSQFMLVSPGLTLPVNLMTFEAQPAKKSIELTWKTAQERNNRGFAVERSTNGADFTTIGWVAGVGTTDDASSYKYSDHFVQPNTVYYYRLQQMDYDNRATFSNVRQAKIAGSGLSVTISPNPVKGQMTVFVSGSTKAADVSLVNAKGQTVGRWTKAEISSPYSIDVNRFAKGYYTVIIHLDDEEITRQVVIQ